MELKLLFLTNEGKPGALTGSLVQLYWRNAKKVVAVVVEVVLLLLLHSSASSITWQKRRAWRPKPFFYPSSVSILSFRKK